MGHYIALSDDLLPWDFGMRFAKGLRCTGGGLADNFDEPFQRQLFDAVLGIRGERQVPRELHREARVLHHVPKVADIPIIRLHISPRAS